MAYAAHMKTEVGLPIVMRLDDGMTTPVSSPAAETLEYLILLALS